ncbi:hypothetical protein BN2497_1769 [Janthinobacterium sp. CG23_2]|nr:hypothetical protein BN2497_1769 [Janthinobacterium sp. CG23_2]CUU27282.1 hypothetical protein BN3177_1769 [Janthinobacterium sp. CG23_2]
MIVSFHKLTGGLFLSCPASGVAYIVTTLLLAQFVFAVVRRLLYAGRSRK